MCFITVEQGTYQPIVLLHWQESTAEIHDWFLMRMKSEEHHANTHENQPKLSRHQTWQIVDWAVKQVSVGKRSVFVESCEKKSFSNQTVRESHWTLSVRNTWLHDVCRVDWSYQDVNLFVLLRVFLLWDWGKSHWATISETSSKKKKEKACLKLLSDGPADRVSVNASPAVEDTMTRRPSTLSYSSLSHTFPWHLVISFILLQKYG